jgi:ribosome-associated toxin RatA of RatAB toxin-antitoxin module
MRSYEAAEIIRATPDQVWAVLGDVAHYPDWDSGVERVEDLQPSFDQFARGLKARVEGGGHG